MSGGRRTSRGVWVALGVAVVLAAGIYAGLNGRRGADAALKRATEAAAVPTVAVVSPSTSAPSDELVLPGTARAYTDAPIYARSSGYLKKWYVDIGTRVTQGQLLAEIDAPEVDQQLRQARADLETARANMEMARTTADRWQALLKREAVARQDADEKVADYTAKKAIVDSNAANVKRLEDMTSFQRITAPFDGVITARNTDIGALVDAGASAQARELFRLGAIHKVRVFVSVPQTYAQAARPGTPTAVTLEEIPGKVFHGTLARTSNAVDPVARTMLTEVEVDNPTGEILPGAYVVVRLGVGRGTRGLTIPANTLLFRSEGLRVAVVRDGRAELVPVTIRRDFGRSVEVVSGLQPTDSVILDPADSLVSGTPVRVRRAESGAAPKKP
ncbi:MAG TPA: efflux RND transporter periplasmic adaptor subunit [Methylomirabilota bacterium]|nr:efflux RND transporter periplasmic adaptor subunit [Methylomirabilota bacterium]